MALTRLEKDLEEAALEIRATSTRMAMVEVMKKRSALRDTMARVDMRLKDLLSEDDSENVGEYVDRASAKLNEAEDTVKELSLILVEKEQEVKTEQESRNLAEITRLSREPSVALSQNIQPTPSAAIQYKQHVYPLPSFDGLDSTKWPSFEQSFNTYLRSSTFTDMEKIMVLKSCLTGKAHVASNQYESVGENFESLFSYLKKRYGDSSMIRHTLNAKLNRLKPKSEKIPDLQEFLDEFGSVYTQLKTTGVALDVDQVEIMLLNKFPPWMIRQILESKAATNTWTVSMMFSKIEHIIQVSTLSNAIAQQPEKRPDQIRKANVNVVKTYNPKTQRRDTDDKAPNAPEKKRWKWKRICIFCQQEHRGVDCTTYSTLEERLKQLKSLDRCLQCGSRSHSKNKCNNTRPCSECNELHHPAVCPTLLTNPKAPPTKLAASATATQSARDDALMIINIKCGLPSNRITLSTLLDPGANINLISEDAVKKLQLQPKDTRVMHIGGWNGEPQKTICSVYELPILQQIQGKTIENTLTVTSTPKLAVATQCEKTYGGFQAKEVQLELLLGGTTFWRSFQGIEERGTQNEAEFFEIKTAFGPVYTGDLPHSGHEVRPAVCMARKLTNPEAEKLDHKLDRLWALESLGIQDNAVINDDDAAVTLFNQTVKFNEKEARYEVAWLYSNELGPTRNDGVARKRLWCFWEKAQNNPELLELVQHYFDEQEQMGFLEKVVDNDEDQEETSMISYLPWLIVLTPAKTTTKVRLVLDASASNRAGRSLNSTLYRGPILTPDLTAMMMNFRCQQFVVASDVTKAYMQVSLRKDDRDVTRIYWLKDKTKPPYKSNLQVLRYRRLIFGAKTSPYLLAAVIREHVTKVTRTEEERQVGEEIVKQIYVDNLVLMGKTRDEVMRKVRIAHNMFQEMSMPLREYMTNDPTLTSQLRREGFDCAEGSIQKLLGLAWNKDTDELSFKWPEDLTAKTKKDVVAITAKNFDLLGYTSPARLPLKLFAQRLAKEKMDWKTPMSEVQQAEWNKIVQLIQGQEIKIPRLIYNAHEEQTVAAVFVDGSSYAYGAVCYVGPEGKRPTNIISKSRVAPIEKITIPRSELMGAKLGAELMRFVEKQIRPTKLYMFSDSKILLDWLKSNTPKEKFVENRLKDIRRPDVKFFHIATDLNPADLCSRGTSLSELQESEEWWRAPKFMEQAEETWPKADDSFYGSEEMPEDEVHAVHTMIGRGKNVDQESVLANNELDLRITTCKSYEQLVRRVEVILKFAKKEARSWDPTTLKKEAETKLVIWAQATLDKSDDEMKVKNMFITNGVLMIQNRMPDSDEYARIYLPHGRFTQLLISHIHRKLAHCGTPHTLSKFNETYYTPRARQQVKKVLNSCRTCRRFTMKPFSLPQMHTLPIERVQRSRPFDHTGVDVHGPLRMKQEIRKYIAIFTCYSTRAIHLEPLDDLTAREFLNALRRFVSVRGRPTMILSDNGSNIKCVATSCSDIWRTDPKNDCLQYCATEKIRWKFMTEKSPWTGSIFERLNALVKRCLKVLNRKSPEDFPTTVAEITAILNSRPLVYVPSESEGNVLTPNDFLAPLTKNGTPSFENIAKDPDYRPKIMVRDELTDLWKVQSAILDKFWTKFKAEYLPYLRSRQQYVHNQKASTAVPRIGSLVIMEDETEKNRGEWPLAIIQELPKSSDNRIRKAMVKTLNGKTFKRPLCQLYPAECEDLKVEESKTVQTPTQELDPAPSDPPAPTSSKAPRYHLRNRTVFTTLFLNLLMCFSIHSVGANIIPCREGETGITVLSEYCVPVAKQLMITNAGSICIKKLKCEEGHVRTKYRRGKLESGCGEICKCPDRWEGCNHYDARKLKRPDQEEEPESASKIEEVLGPHLAKRKNPNHRIPAIELPGKDDTYLVDELAIMKKQEQLCLEANGQTLCVPSNMENVYYFAKEGTLKVQKWGYVKMYNTPEEPTQNPTVNFLSLFTGIGICALLFWCLNCIKKVKIVSQWLKKLILLPITLAWKVARLLWREGPEPLRRRRVGPIIITTILISLATEAAACTDPFVIQGTGRECKEGKCSEKIFEHFSINQRGQKVCLKTMKDRKDYGMIEITLSEVGYKCVEKELTYTFESEVVTESIVRCPMTGQCGLKECNEDYNSEFSKSSSTVLHSSRCEVISGGLPELCLILTRACLFTRNFIRPFNEVPIKVKSCAWKQSARITINSQNRGVKSTVERIISPGEIIKIEELEIKIELILIQKSRPEEIKLIHMPDEIRVMENWPGLTCPTPKLNLKCATPLKECKCNYNGRRQICECPSTYPSKAETKSLKEANLKTNEGNVVIKSEDEVTVMMSIRGELNMDALEDEDKCEFQVQGNVITCRSQNVETMAEIKCNQTTHHIICQPKISTSKLIDLDLPEERCIATCGKGSQEVILQKEVEIYRKMELQKLAYSYAATTTYTQFKLIALLSLIILSYLAVKLKIFKFL